MKYKMIILFSMLVLFQACGNNRDESQISNVVIPEPGIRVNDGNVVRGIAMFSIESERQTAMNKMIKDFNNLFLFPNAYASTITAPVAYNNAQAVVFTVNTAGLVPGTFTGLNLNLGSFTITALKDNNTEVCGVSGTEQCVNAYLRVYTTGSVEGFVNTTHTPQYGVPLYTSGENPAVPLVLDSPGVRIKSVLNMSPNKHVVNLTDFVTTNYTVKSDFSNAGFGSYQTTYIIEYVLSL